MGEDSIGLNADGVGKKVRTNSRVVGADTVHEEVHIVTDGAGNIVDPRKNLDVTSSALPTGAATEATLGTVHGHVDSIDTKIATETTLGTVHGHVDSIDGKITACNTGAVAGSLTQSTKHDSKVYIYAFGDIAATGLLSLTKAAGKVIKIHFYSLQSTVDGVTAYFYEETSLTQLSKKWVLNAREGQESPFVTAPANLPKCATQNKDMGINVAGGTSPHIYWEIIYSVDDAS